MIYCDRGQRADRNNAQAKHQIEECKIYLFNSDCGVGKFEGCCWNDVKADHGKKLTMCVVIVNEEACNTY